MRGEGLAGVADQDGDQIVQDYLRRIAHFLTRSDAGAVLRALLGHAQHDPAFAALLRERYLTEQRRRDLLPLQRAIRRGQLPADLDANTELDHLLGPICHRVLVTGDPVDELFIDRLVGNLLLRSTNMPGGRGPSAAWPATPGDDA
ncbi:TetR-like C-terminal domain-containing protein [Longispora urticae]